MAKQKIKQNYFTVIPSLITKDERLTDFAKLLYGQLVSQSDVDGQCWPGNKYLAEFNSKSERVISRTLKLLEDCEYIIIEVAKTQRGSKRLITLADAAAINPKFKKHNKNSHSTKMSSPHSPKTSDPLDKNVRGGRQKRLVLNIEEKKKEKKKEKRGSSLSQRASEIMSKNDSQGGTE